MDFFLPVASSSTTPAVDLFTIQIGSSSNSTGSSSGLNSRSEVNNNSSTSSNSNDKNPPATSNGSKNSKGTNFNTKCLNKILKCSIEPKIIFEMMLETIPSEQAKQILEKLEVIIENETNSSKSRSSSSEKTNKRKHNSTEITEAEVAKKKKETPPIKNLELFNEWKAKLEEVAKMDLPSLAELDNLDELPESKKHIQINYKFLTQKKNNHTEQVRITYRNFFEKYPKLFYAYSYWTLNGKVKVIKEVFVHHPNLLHKITDIPENYKAFWKEEISSEDL